MSKAPRIKKPEGGEAYATDPKHTKRIRFDFWQHIPLELEVPMLQRLKKLAPWLALLLLMLALGACAPAAAPATNDQPQMANGLEGGKLTFRHQLPGEDFVLVTEFVTTYKAKYWHVTTAKNILMRAWIETLDGAKVDAEVLVEHVHADCSIVSKYSGWHGVKTDTMDDSIHGVGQPGFWISQYPYEEWFAIEGYSKDMWSSWAVYYTDWYATSESKPKPMTEQNLVSIGGTTGQSFQVVWDLAIRYPAKGETLYHTTSVIDNFTVPIDQNP